jgi:hypothetical protein
VDGKQIDCTKRKTVKAYVLGVQGLLDTSDCVISTDPVCIEIPDPSLLTFLALLVKQFSDLNVVELVNTFSF